MFTTRARRITQPLISRWYVRACEFRDLLCGMPRKVSRYSGQMCIPTVCRSAFFAKTAEQEYGSTTLVHVLYSLLHAWSFLCNKVSVPCARCAVWLCIWAWSFIRNIFGKLAGWLLDHLDRWKLHIDLQDNEYNVEDGRYAAQVHPKHRALHWARAWCNALWSMQCGKDFSRMQKPQTA